jgi:hypothetical protein
LTVFLLYAIVAVVGLVVLSGAILVTVTFAQRIESKEFHECCPPGVGCNDGQSRLCRRRMAQRYADFERGIILDRKWIALCGTPVWRVRKHAAAMREYALQRDSIIEAEIVKVGQSVQEMRPQLAPPSHREVVDMIESPSDQVHGLQGEVLDP